MRVLVTGVTGQLGFDVMRLLLNNNYDVIGTSRANTFSSVILHKELERVPYHSLDITNEKSVKQLVEKVQPEAIIHCAAWTAVDAAENNIEKVKEININGTKYLAEAAKEADAKFVYISTDYVFDGSGKEPWAPDNNEYAPINVYGKSKLAGEQVVSSILKKYYIVRISWVYGINGSNFVKTMLRVGKKHNHVSVVKDQIGTPTYTLDLARLLIDMIDTDKYGYYHVTNEGGYISWFDFTKEIYRQIGLETKIIPVTTEEYGVTEAKRPFNSRFDKSKLVNNGFKPLPDWKDALNRFLVELSHLEGEDT